MYKPRKIRRGIRFYNLPPEKYYFIEYRVRGTYNREDMSPYTWSTYQWLPNKKLCNLLLYVQRLLSQRHEVPPEWIIVLSMNRV